MVNTRAALESLWKGTCTVVAKVEKLDATTKITSFSEKELFSNKPCKLVYKTLSANGDGIGSAVTQAAKLILGVENTIPAGSKITVTQNGVTSVFTKSGEPGIYTNHQEIMLELFPGWA